MIAELLNNAELLLQKGLHVNDITGGYLKGQAKAIEVLEGRINNTKYYLPCILN